MAIIDHVGRLCFYTEWRQARLNIDYHVDVERHYYSAPYRLIRQVLDIVA